MPAADKANTAAFAKHKAQQESTRENEKKSAKMSLMARFVLFLCLPTFMGMCGLGVSYLKTMRSSYGKDEKPHEVSFDNDFVMPFLLSLALVVVLGMQTKGFTTSERKGAFQWPKARVVKKIRRERKVVDEHGNTIRTERLDENGNVEDDKKDR
mmetsp:Transcript_1739/g.4191  ORF Transcript_1739/g.4191 Transcript_1739/m.4191 type:complete len:154 (-) Transcript_1739:233-694(-)